MLNKKGLGQAVGFRASTRIMMLSTPPPPIGYLQRIQQNARFPANVPSNAQTRGHIRISLAVGRVPVEHGSSWPHNDHICQRTERNWLGCKMAAKDISFSCFVITFRLLLHSAGCCCRPQLGRRKVSLVH